MQKKGPKIALWATKEGDKTKFEIKKKVLGNLSMTQIKDYNRF